MVRGPNPGLGFEVEGLGFRGLGLGNQARLSAVLNRVSPEP